MELTFGLLALAVIALWFPPVVMGKLRVKLWLPLLIAAVLAGLFYGFLLSGILWLILLAMLTPAARKLSLDHWQEHAHLCWAGIVILMTAVMFHKLPGFNNPLVLDKVQISATAIPYSRYLNFDKTALGLLVLALTHPLASGIADWRRLLTLSTRFFLGSALVLMTACLLVGYVSFEPKWSPYLPLWMATNLLSVCLVEEALFRGLLQRKLCRVLGGYHRAGVISIVVSALLFGLFHISGGWTYVALASIAGLFYGGVYHRTGRIEAAMLVHFATNLFHFLLFTYPANASAFTTP